MARTGGGTHRLSQGGEHVWFQSILSIFENSRGRNRDKLTSPLALCQSLHGIRKNFLTRSDGSRFALGGGGQGLCTESISPTLCAEKKGIKKKGFGHGGGGGGGIFHYDEDVRLRRKSEGGSREGLQRKREKERRGGLPPFPSKERAQSEERGRE